MRNRLLQATGIGSKSFENERAVELPPRQSLGFDCPSPHHFSVIFSDWAKLPTSWECPTCRASAVRLDGVLAEIGKVKPQRTHWDMLLERRSVADLEELLAEHLALLRAGKIGPGVPERTVVVNKKSAA